MRGARKNCGTSYLMPTNCNDRQAQPRASRGRHQIGERTEMVARRLWSARII